MNAEYANELNKQNELFNEISKILKSLADRDAELTELLERNPDLSDKLWNRIVDNALAIDTMLKHSRDGKEKLREMLDCFELLMKIKEKNHAIS